jgi:hypothetical protein
VSDDIQKMLYPYLELNGHGMVTGHCLVTDGRTDNVTIPKSRFPEGIVVFRMWTYILCNSESKVYTWTRSLSRTPEPKISLVTSIVAANSDGGALILAVV